MAPVTHDTLAKSRNLHGSGAPSGHSRRYLDRSMLEGYEAAASSLTSGPKETAVGMAAWCRLT